MKTNPEYPKNESGLSQLILMGEYIRQKCVKEEGIKVSNVNGLLRYFKLRLVELANGISGITYTMLVEPIDNRVTKSFTYRF